MRTICVHVLNGSVCLCICVLPVYVANDKRRQQRQEYARELKEQMREKEAGKQQNDDLPGGGILNLGGHGELDNH